MTIMLNGPIYIIAVLSFVQRFTTSEPTPLYGSRLRQGTDINREWVQPSKAIFCYCICVCICSQFISGTLRIKSLL